ncbi:FRG domain-containing protein [Oerskovia enterophila]
MAETAARAWIDSGWGYEVRSRDQLLRTVGRVSTLRNGRIYAWRGQSRARYDLSSSLYRHLAKSGPVDEERMRETEKRIIREARRFGLGRDLGASNSDAHLLASLQHHGVPTRLLDVTSNPFTALWFATRRPKAGQNSAGVLFAIDVTEMPWAHTFAHDAITYAQAAEPLSAQFTLLLMKSFAERQPFRLYPAIPDDRMRAQEGYFIGSPMPDAPQVPRVPDLDLAAGSPPGADALLRLAEDSDRGVGRPARLPFLALVIPPKVKAAMDDPLTGTFNRRRRVLFPDVDGFRDAFNYEELDLKSPGPSYRFEVYDR